MGQYQQMVKRKLGEGKGKVVGMVGAGVQGGLTHNGMHKATRHGGTWHGRTKPKWDK